MSEGLHNSEVLVFIATRSSLQSVWCLMELYEAAKINIPVVVVVDSTFNVNAAISYLEDLENQLGKINMASLRSLRSKVQEAGFQGTLAEFAQLVKNVLQLTDESRHIQFYNNGTDQIMSATCVGLVKRLAEETGREIKWQDAPSYATSFASQDGKLKLGGCAACCGLGPTHDKNVHYKMFIAYAPDDEVPQPVGDLAAFLQLRLQRELKGPVVMQLDELGA